ncbi:hypothetical protein ETAA8_30020 [Anatilimnocola aggregata]|uniref:MFS transporter n=1 Tax=Anatilimnocola aggregata TaxID=2528021 RepID=A0A517YCG2_9BACT|nr:DUF5690 family protein [Anatilimnocola aggregata]QDU27911.1 hypothetical protein ETAA8_30020 [Anatilimnocola aggregata]
MTAVDRDLKITPADASVAGVAPLSGSRTNMPDWFWQIWSVVAAFGTYFCMYAFRKPFTAATFEDAMVAGVTLKTALVISQTLGYMLSKFIGIKVIAEMPPHRRAGGILLLVMIAQFALVLFGLLPSPWNVGSLFLNGLSLGMVFGLVLGFLEGRRSTEALTAGLCTSFILADGMTKSVGAWLLIQKVPEPWMPSVAGLLFVVPLVIFVAMLAMIPPPNQRDIAERAARVTMSSNDRWQLYFRYMFGLTLLVILYLLISILRSIRSDFAPELWLDLLGKKAVPAIYSQSEYCVALGVLLANGSAVFVRDSRRAFFISLGICGAGLGLILVALLCRQAAMIDGFTLMVLIGLGLYLPYVAVHTKVFERFLAMTRERGNLGFLMYVADSIGYLGVVGVLLGKNLLNIEGSFLNFFLLVCWIATGLALCCLAGSWRYFSDRVREPKLVVAAEVTR